MIALRKLFFRFLLLIGLIIALTIITTALVLYWKRTRAVRLLNEVKTQHWSSVNFAKAKAISERYGGHPGTFGRSGMPCIPSGCRFDIEISNFPLDYLRVAPKTVFDVSIHVQDDSVDAVSTALLSIITLGSPPEQATIGAHVGEEIKQKNPTVPGYMATLNLVDNSLLEKSVIAVGLTPTATSGEQRAAYDFNLVCLTKFGGCKSVRDFLPIAAEKALNRNDVMPQNGR